MSDIIDAIEQVLKDEAEEAFILCKDKSNQESIRVMTYQERRKLPKSFQDEIAISKHKEDNGKLYIKVYKKPKNGVLIRDKETGELVSKGKGISSEKQRQIDLMKKDGKTEEEIKELLKGEE
jgi:hypothetical protein